MRRIMILFSCITMLVLTGCGQSDKQMASGDSQKTEENSPKTVSGDYQVNYDIDQFQIPDEIYVSEMSLQNIEEDSLFEIWNIPKEKAHFIEKSGKGETYYSINGKRFILAQGPVCSSLGECDNDNKQNIASNEEMKEQAKRLFEKWEKISGVNLDIDHIKEVESSGDKSGVIQYECSQIYHGVPCVGNFNMDNPYMKSTGNESEVNWLSVISGSYCYVNYIVNSSEGEVSGVRKVFGAQKMFDEKKKIKLDKPMLSVEKIVDAMQAYMQSLQFNGQTYDVKEASVCYIPLPTSNEGKVFKLVPCWQVLVNGNETWIQNGQKTERSASRRFYVDAVTGYVYDVNN